MPPVRAIPPSARHLLDDMQALHRDLLQRTDAGGSIHIANPAALHDTVQALAHTLDRVPTILALLTEHLTRWNDSGALAVSTPTPGGDATADDACALVMTTLSSAAPAQRHTVRSLRIVLSVLSDLELRAPDPAQESGRS